MQTFPKLLLTSFAFALAGCGSMSNFRDIQDAGPTIYVRGSVESIRDAAVSALSERRLDSPQFEKIEKGLVVFAEQSSMAALVFNSYGGFGKVTIKGENSSGSGTVAVSAIPYIAYDIRYPFAPDWQILLHRAIYDRSWGNNDWMSSVKREDAEDEYFYIDVDGIGLRAWTR